MRNRNRERVPLTFWAHVTNVQKDILSTTPAIACYPNLQAVCGRTQIVQRCFNILAKKSVSLCVYVWEREVVRCCLDKCWNFSHTNVLVAFLLRSKSSELRPRFQLLAAVRTSHTTVRKTFTRHGIALWVIFRHCKLGLINLTEVVTSC